jgi:5-methylcytosine-specific restriction protein A
MHQCTIRFKGRAAFLYVYHQSNSLKIYLVGGLEDEGALTELLHPTAIKLQRRKSVTTEWAKRTPFIIQLHSEDDITNALPALIHSADEHQQHSLSRSTFITPSEEDAYQFEEGSKIAVLMNRYERNLKARLECIKIYGLRCSVCGFDFAKVYGEIGSGFIHVHHLNPLALKSGSYKVNPKRDLRPVCPNCHDMLHRQKPPYKIEELRDIMKQQS